MVAAGEPLDPESIIDCCSVPGQPLGLYVVGCFAKAVTVCSQQVRAANLVESLTRCRELGVTKRVLVIGAGAAGLTAAAYAAHTGARVWVLERAPVPLSLFRGNTTRWIYPHLYEWPFDGWDREVSDVRHLRWQQGSAHEVVVQLESAWQRERGLHRIQEHMSVSELQLSAAGDYRWQARWQHAGLPQAGDFDFILGCVGFGVENAGMKLEYASYWDTDDLDQIRADRRRYLVSGTGDGGLSEVLRLRLCGTPTETGFRPHSLLQEIRRQPRARELEKRLREIDEAEPRPAQLVEQYFSLPVAWVDDILSPRLRHDTEVTLVGLDAEPFTKDSFRLNRFLVSRLLHRGWGVRHERCQIVLDGDPKPVRPTDAPRASVQRPSTHGSFSAVLPSDLGPQEFDALVLRRGAWPPAVDLLGAWASEMRVRWQRWSDETRWSLAAAGSAPESEPLDLATLNRAIADCDDILKLVEVLLVFCRARRAELAAARLEDPVLADWLRKQTRAATQLFAEPEETIDPALRAKVIEFVARSAPPPPGGVLVARVLAVALDAARGPLFFGLWRDRGWAMSGSVRELSPLEAIPSSPLSALPLERRRRLAAELARDLQPGLDALPYVGLSPSRDQLGSLHIEMCRHRTQLRGSDPELRVGALLPLATTAELIIEPTESSGVCFGMGVRDPERHAARVLDLLQAAEAHGMRVVLLPEYTVPPTLLEELRRWLRAESRQLAVLIAGSHHHETPHRERRHRAPVLLGCGGESAQDKLRVSGFRQRDEHGRDADWTEDVSVVPPVLRVHVCQDGTFAAVIGTDLLDERIEAVLADLRLDAVFVPSCSHDPERLREINERAQAMAGHGPRIVVAHTPAAVSFAPGRHAVDPARALMSICLSGTGVWSAIVL